jgi:mRNA-degrading endonuclease toxin of MazEF toxin-antitoxin module
LKAWEIYTAGLFDEHPCVLVSNQPRIDAKPEVVVLSCRPMRPANEREPRANEVLLDEADGLDLKTLCRCDLLFTLEKAKLGRRRGIVTPARRNEIARRIIQGLAIAGL